MIARELIGCLIAVTEAPAPASMAELEHFLSEASGPHPPPDITFLLSKGEQELKKSIHEIREKYQQAMVNMLRVQPSVVFRLVYDIERQMGETIIGTSEQFLGPLHHFERSYQSFVGSPDPGRAAETISAGWDLLNQLRTYRQLAAMVLSFAGERVTEPQEEHGALELFLPHVTSIKEVANKLTAINSLYTEVANLIGVSLTEFPLRVGHIESGSLWVKVFGETRVITLMTKFMESTIGFLYRRHTTEGKIDGLPRRTGAVDQMLELSERMRALGFDVAALNDTIEKSAIIIAKDLNNLLLGEPRVILNKITYSVGDDSLKQLLDAKHHLLPGPDPRA